MNHTINPDEHLLIARRGRVHSHESEVECYFSTRGCLHFIFYPQFWEKYGKFVGRNDHVRFFGNSDMTYVRMQAQPVKGVGSYKMSIRPGCNDIRQIILPKDLADQFPKHEGRKTLTVSEEKRSIILSF